MELHRGLLLVLALSWPAAAAAAAAGEVCDDGGYHPTPAGCVDSSGLARGHGAVWMERAGRHVLGGCVRRVSACVDGLLLRPVPDRVEHCPQTAANPACRMESFFTCCPVFDCPSKLASLISPLSPGQDPSSPAVEVFLSRVEVPEIFNAGTLPLPVARTQLNATAIRQLLDWLESRPVPSSPAERAVHTELRNILAVLEAGAEPPPVPAGARRTLQTLRGMEAEQRRAVVAVLRRLLVRFDAGDVPRPVTFGWLFAQLMEMAGDEEMEDEFGTVEVTVFATLLLQLQVDSAETPLEDVLRYIVIYGLAEAEPSDNEAEPSDDDAEPSDDESEPSEPEGKTTPQVCSKDQEGVIWAEMEVPVDGRCVRHVRACREGRVVSSPELQRRQHLCNTTGPELCRLESFFTCCPVFDCGEKLRLLQGRNTTSPGSLTSVEFLLRVNISDLRTVTSPVPIVSRALHIATFVEMREVLRNSTLRERVLLPELDQIVGLFSGTAGGVTGKPSPDAIIAEILQRLVDTLDNMVTSVKFRGTSVDPSIVPESILTAERLHELRDALMSRAVADSDLPVELPAAVARLLRALASSVPGVTLQPDLRDLAVAVARGHPDNPLHTRRLLDGLIRALDAWLDLLPASAFALLPDLDSPGPESTPASIAALLRLLLSTGDGSDYVPLLPSDGAQDDPQLLAVLVRLVERLQRPGQPATRRLRPALIRLVRRLARPGGADSSDAVRLVMRLVRRLAETSRSVSPDVFQMAVELLERMGGHRQPVAAPRVLQVLVQLVEGLMPEQRAVSPEVRAMIVELLRRLGRTPDTVSPAILEVVMTVVRRIGDVTRRDVRPAMMRDLVTLMGRMGGAPAAADPAALQVLVRLIRRLGQTQEGAQNAAAHQLLLQLVEQLTTAPEEHPPEVVQLVIQLVEQVVQPQPDAAGPEVLELVLKLIERLQRPQRPLAPQVSRPLIQLVFQLVETHGPATPQLRQLMTALLPLLAAESPNSAQPDDLLQVLNTMLEGVGQPRTAQGAPDVQELLLQLLEQLSVDQRPMPPRVRKLLLELFIGTQTGGVSDDEVMTLVLAMMESLARPGHSLATPSTTDGVNVSTVLVEDTRTDLQDVRRLIDLIVSQGRPGSRTANPADSSIPAVPMGEDASGGSDTKELLKLLMTLVGSEVNAPDVPSILNLTTVVMNDDREALNDMVQLLEVIVARINTSKPHTPGFFNITGTIVDGEKQNFEDMQRILELLLARVSAMGQKPDVPGFFNITGVLINENPSQFEEFRGLLEVILTEIETMESNSQPTGFLNISGILVNNNRVDFTGIQELLRVMLAQITARNEAPRSPGFFNISFVENDQDEFQNVRYLLELLRSQTRGVTPSQPHQGFPNIPASPVNQNQDEFDDMQHLLRLILSQTTSSKAPNFPGFLNISSVLVNETPADMENLRVLLKMVTSRMSTGHDMPSEQLSAVRELILRFFNRPTSTQDMDVQGIISMLIELGEADAETTFSVSDFMTLIQSLDVPEDHPTFTDDIRKLTILLQEGSQSPNFLRDLTEVVMRLVRLVELSRTPVDVSPEMLVRLMIRQVSQPTTDDADNLPAALVRFLEQTTGPRETPLTFGGIVPPPVSLPAELRDLVLRLQLAARRRPPLLQSLPQLLRLLTALGGGPSRAGPDVLRFAAQLAAVVLERAPDAGDRVLVPQILLRLRQLARQPRQDRLTPVIVLLRRLLTLEQQRGSGGGGVTITVISGSNGADDGLLAGRNSEGDDASLPPDLTQQLLDALLALEQNKAEARLTDLLPQITAVLRLVVDPPANAGRLPDDTLRYVTQLTRAVLERSAPRGHPLLPRVLLLLRRIEPQPQPDALGGVLALLEQLLTREQQRVMVTGGADSGQRSAEVPADLLEALLRLEEVSERGRPADYLPLAVALLRLTGRQPAVDPLLMMYVTELLRSLLRRDNAKLDPVLAPQILEVLSRRENRPAALAEVLPMLELLVMLGSDRASDTETHGSGTMNELLGLLSLSGRSSSGGDDVPLDFAGWLTHLVPTDPRKGSPDVSEALISHLVHLLRVSDTRPAHDVDFMPPEHAARILLLLSGQRDDPAAVPVSAYEAILSLLNPEHEPDPSHTAEGLLRSLLFQVWGVAGRPDSVHPPALYRQLLTLLTGRPADLPASGAALRRALLLLLAGPDAAGSAPDAEDAVRLLLTLVVGGGGGDDALVTPAVVRVVTALLSASPAGGQAASVSEEALRFLVKLLTDPAGPGPQPAPEDLVRLLVAIVTSAPTTGDSGDGGVSEVALRLLLRLPSGPNRHRTIPVPRTPLRALLTPPASRNSGGDDSDSDSEDVVLLLMKLLSDPTHGVDGVSDNFTMTTFGGTYDHDDHEDRDEDEYDEHHDPPAVPETMYHLLTTMMTDAPAGDPSSPSHPVFQRLLSLLGEDSFEPDLIPDSLYNQLIERLSADRFDPASAPQEVQDVLLTLGGGRLGSDRLFRRLLLLLAQRGLPVGAAPPGRLLHRCRLVCDAAAGGASHTRGVQVLPGRTPITFVGENHVIVLNR